GGSASAGIGGDANNIEGSGTATVNVTGGSLSFGTALDVEAAAKAGNGTAGGGDSWGGTASILADAGSISGVGTIILGTKAEAGNATGAGSFGGEANGGQASISTANAGTVQSTTGFLNLDSAGF